MRHKETINHKEKQNDHKVTRNDTKHLHEAAGDTKLVSAWFVVGQM